MKSIIFRSIVLTLVLFLCIDLYALDFGFINKQTTSDFTLEELSGRLISLRDFKGKPVILFFWATNCPYCRKELDKLDIEYKKMSEDGIELLSINIGEPRLRVKRFLSKYSSNFLTLLDFYSRVANDYGIIGIPTLFLVSKEGEILYQAHRLPDDYKAILLEK